MNEEKIVDMLTKNSVSIVTRKSIEVEGQTYQLGIDHRRAYINSTQGREAIAAEQPEDVVTAIMTIWGDKATVTEDDPGSPDH